MTDTECEARAAERGLDDSARRQQLRKRALLNQIHVNRNRGRVNGQRKFILTQMRIAQNVSGLHNIGIRTACTARNDTLLYLQLAVDNLICQAEAELRIVCNQLFGLFYLAQDVAEICIQLVNLIGMRRMERQRDHRLDGAQVNINHAVVICDICRIQFLVCVRSAVHGEELLGVLIGAPDGGKTCGLGGHNVHAVSVIGVQRPGRRTP